MIATFFRWTVKPGCEEEFHARWNAATEWYLTQGSNGSSLWRTEDGDYCAFALWPDRETRAAAFASAESKATLAPMRDLVAETKAWVDLDSLENYWRLP